MVPRGFLTRLRVQCRVPCGNSVACLIGVHHQVPTMSSEQLTEGVIGSMLASTDGTTPVVPKCQILSLKKLQTTSASANVSERYRVVLSDGVHYTQAMLATQLKPLVENGMLDKNVVVRITQFTSNTVQNRKILILLNRFLPPCPTALAIHKTSRPLHLSLKRSRKVRTVSLLCPRLPHKPHDLRPRSLLRLSPARVAWPKQAQVCPCTLLTPSLHTKTNGRSRRVSLSRRTSSTGLMRVATVSCSVCI